jgi:hypothetical protein
MDGSKYFSPAAIEKLTRLMSWFENKPISQTTVQLPPEYTQIEIFGENNHISSMEQYVDIAGLVRYTDTFYDRYVAPAAIQRPLEQMGLQRSNNVLLNKLMTSFDDLSESSYRNIMRTMYLAGALPYLKANLMEIAGNSDIRIFLTEFVSFVTNPTSSPMKLRGNRMLIKKKVPSTA